jgi:two-component system response regulator HydG
MRARLIIEKGEGTPRVLELEPAKVATLGRSRDSTVVLHDEHASRQHAQVLFRNGQWLLRDLETLNGTFLDAVRISQEVPLQNGQLVAIADMRLRFESGDPGRRPSAPPEAKEALTTSEERSSHSTRLQADELALLYDFMSSSVGESDGRIIIERVLAAVLQHTGARLVGFLSLDPEDPLPKVVFPQRAQVDPALSRRLTARVQESRRTVWLAQGEISSSDSLASYLDAVCVPLVAEGQTFGALHVYKEQGPFTEREVRFCELASGYAANSLARLQLCRRLEAENSRLRSHASEPDQLVGDSPALRKLRQLIDRAAPTPSTVLIHGETGSGKELVALALHRKSPRCNGPLVVANCGAIAESLLESELFGHCKGAFTGAVTAREGLFQQADDGTLFLDEIGDLSPECQVKLLRAIEGRSFRPLGSEAEVRADVRIIAATNKDLEREVAEGRFRQDLFFRLRVVYIPVPPLRDHAEDIPALVEHFLGLLPGGRQKRLSDAALRRLQEYPWPGNIRQLRTVLENALVMADGPTIDVNDLWLAESGPASRPEGLKLSELEAWAITRALAQAAGKIGKAAQLLGISRETLGVKMKLYRIGKHEQGETTDA